MGCGASSGRRARELGGHGTPGSGTPEEFDRRYVVREELGKGAFGRVFATFDPATGEQSAVKIVAAKPGSSDNERQITMHRAACELQMWRRVCGHSSIVELRESFLDSERACMVMERCECSVADMLAASPSILKNGLPRLFRAMLLGIKACHDARVVHRDVKAANFLVSSSGVKLCDFGVAARLPHSGGLVGEYGTYPLMSPEMLKHAPYGCETDVWSFGAAAYHAMFQEFPYHPKTMTKEAVKEAIRAGEPSPRRLLQHKDGAAVSFLRLLLWREPSLRPSADEALRHSFLVNLHQNSITSFDTQDTVTPCDSDSVVIVDGYSESLEIEDVDARTGACGKAEVSLQSGVVH